MLTMWEVLSLGEMFEDEDEAYTAALSNIDPDDILGDIFDNHTTAELLAAVPAEWVEEAYEKRANADIEKWEDFESVSDINEELTREYYASVL